MRKLALLSILAPFGSAFAAVPTEVTTAITSGGTDAAAVGAAVLVAIIGIFAVKLMRRGL